ncbi:MAG TPA: hypothetical protein VFM09_01330 [Marmoricola sp.]|nr:hypothetical protein [Marmoricola sp.]
MTDVTQVGAGGDADRLDETDTPARRRLGTRGLLLLAAVLFVVLVVAAAYAVVMYTRVHSFDAEDHQRADAVAVAEQFALRMDNFDSAHLNRYTSGIEKVLTTKAKAKFDPVFKQFAQVYAQGHVSGKGRVLVSGVGTLDQDSATVLVVHDMTAKSDSGTLVHHYRWSVSLDRVNGRWLVDDFNQVG